MMVAWMIAATVLGLVGIAAAMLFERALRTVGRQARIVWLLALGLAAGWPVAASMLPTSAPSAVTVAEGAAGPSIAGDAASVGTGVSLREVLARFDGAALVLWGSLTLLLLSRGALALLAIGRMARTSDPRVVDATPVLVSPGGGPAAIGIVNRRILLPAWALELDAPLRAMVIAHEREHVRSGDPALLLLAWFTVALMPWNLALWVIARRLRAATELDCDHRVLRGGADASTYARLLLFIAQRQGPPRFAARITGSPSTLHERITAMHASRHTSPRRRAALFTLAGLAAISLSATPALAAELASFKPRFTAPIEFQQSTPPQEPARPLTEEEKKKRDAERREVEKRALERSSQSSRARDTTIEERERRREREAVVKRERTDAEKRDVEREALAKRERTETEMREVEREALAKRARESRLLREERTPVVREERTPVERDERALAAREGRRAVEARAGAESEQPRYREFVIQEQEQARFAEGGAPAPRYPDILVSAGVDGDVIAQVVVDSSGGILPGSLRIMQKSHDLFEASARAALETTRFTRPRVNGTPVRQLVQLVFRFRVNESEPVSEVRESNRVRTLIVTVRPPKR